MAAPPPALEPYLARMETSLADAEAELTLELGGYREVTRARLWQGQVLVDWERDEDAGGALLRPGLVRRLVALGARLEPDPAGLLLRAAPRIVAALSERHARLVDRLGRPPGLRLRLRFEPDDGPYLGGEETYVVVGGRAEAALVRLTASVRPRTARQTSGRTSPGPS